MLWFDQLQSRIQDKDRLSNGEDDLLESIEQALNEYNGYFPKTCVALLTSDGTKAYDMPSDWILNVSQMMSLEYPLSEILIVSNPNNYPIPAYRETSDYKVCNIQGTARLFLLFDIPNTDQFRVSYSSHYISTALEDVPLHHGAAILNLATSYALMKLASSYSQSVMYDVNVDAVDYRQKARIYQDQAEYYRDLWEQMMSVGKYYAQRHDNQFLDDDIFTQAASSVSRNLNVSRAYRLFRPSYERTAISYSRGY